MSQTTNKEAMLASAPIGKLFFQLAAPAVTAQVINVLYNLVDRMYIGHIPDIGATALTGLGVSMPIILIVSAFAALVSMGGAPRASMALGAGRHEAAEKILGTCTAALILISAVFTVLLIAFGQPILMLFGASKDTIGYAYDYLWIYSCGTLFVQLALGLNAFITAQGFSMTSMLTVTIGAVLNIILDPIFIYVFHMDVKGAALATIISQAVSSIWVVRFLISEKSILRLKAKYIRIEPEILLPCLALGLSPCLMQMTESLVTVSFNVTLQGYGGDIAVGAVSILASVLQLAFLILTGFTQGAQPIMSFNYGARNPKRVKETFRVLFITCMTCSILAWTLCMIDPQMVIHVFTGDEGLIAYAAPALRTYVFGMALFGMQVACQYSFISLGKAKYAIFLAIYRKIILLIPLIFILPMFFEDKAFAVFLAEPTADIIAVLTTGILFFTSFPKILREIEAPAEA